MTASLALDQLQSSAGSGLTAKEAARRLVQTGPNVLTRTEPRSTLAIFADQMTSLPIVLLSASALLSLASGGLIDAAAIMAAVLLNSGIATATESGAERTILGLSRSSCPKGGQQFSSLSLWSPLTSVPAAPPLAPIDPFISESFFVVFDSSV
jgi:magnesium-transporting ATPase (P-type)